MPDKLGALLFARTRLGEIEMPNRIVMAPMPLGQALDGGRAAPMLAGYYAARATAGLIIAAPCAVSAEGMGALGSPGLWRDCHAAAWRSVTDAVHAAGGRIALSLRHAGRLSHPLLQPGGGHPVAPSAIAAPGEIETPAGPRALPVPRPLAADEIPRIVADFAAAAGRAQEAGFDAVEIDAAEGYLLDQFLSPATNTRQDAYGGPPENRARLTLEVAAAVAARIGAGRVGLRISPQQRGNDAEDASPRETFTTLAHLLRPLGLAWLHLVEPDSDGDTRGLVPQLRAAFAGTVILAGDHDREAAEQALFRADAEAIAFGRPFLSEPHLAARLLAGAPLAAHGRAPMFND